MTLAALTAEARNGIADRFGLDAAAVRVALRPMAAYSADADQRLGRRSRDEEGAGGRGRSRRRPSARATLARS